MLIVVAQEAHPNYKFVAEMRALDGSTLKTVSFLPVSQPDSDFFWLEGDYNLGDAVPTAEGFLVAVSVWLDGRSSSDIAIVAINNDGTIVRQSWITNSTTDREANPHLIAFDGGYLLLWGTNGYGRTTLAPDEAFFGVRLDAAGRQISAPEQMGISLIRAYAENLFHFSNGDVGLLTIDPVKAPYDCKYDAERRINVCYSGHKGLLLHRIAACGN